MLGYRSTILTCPAARKVSVCVGLDRRQPDLASGRTRSAPHPQRAVPACPPLGRVTRVTVDLARWQFALTSINHFFFVPVTIGLAFLVAMLETAWYRTGQEQFLRLTR